MGKGLEAGNWAGREPGGKQADLAVLGSSAHFEHCLPQPFFLEVPAKD